MLLASTGSPSVWCYGVGTLKVTAKIKSATCSIDINGEENASVSLPAVKTSDFPKAGVVGTGVTVKMNFKNCDDVAAVSYMITPAKLIPGDSSTVAATGGDAKNIGFKIYNNLGGLMNFESGVYKSTSTRAMTSSLTNRIQYYSTGSPVLAGTVKTTLIYSIDYP